MPGPDSSADHHDLRRDIDSEAFIESGVLGLVHYNMAGEVTDCNEAALEILGLTRDELTGRERVNPRWRALKLDGTVMRQGDDPALETLRTGAPLSDVTLGVGDSSRALRWLSVSTMPMLEDGALSGVVATLSDVTRRVQRERMLGLVTEVTRFAMIAQDEVDVVRHACDVLIERGGFALAWIGTRTDSRDGRLEILGSAGETDVLFDAVTSTSANSVNGALGRLASLAGVVHMVNHLEELVPWGLASGVVVPFTLRRPAVLVVYDRHADAFDPEIIRGLQEVVEEVEFAVAHLGAVQDLRRALDGTIDVIGEISEVHDPYVEGHQSRVARLAEAIALELGLGRDMARLIRQCGEVHDVGTVLVPVELLERLGPLEEVELRMVRRHAEVGSDILTRAALPWPIADVALQHHERLDGSGYPWGLAGDEIILPARIIAVADVVEALAHQRPYRAALGVAGALEEIERGVGTKFDAGVVAACRSVFVAGFAF